MSWIGLIFHSRYGPKKKFHMNCQMMEGALNPLSCNHLERSELGLTTPILYDTWQAMYDVILYHSRGIDGIWSISPTKQKTRMLYISYCFDQGLEHRLVLEAEPGARRLTWITIPMKTRPSYLFCVLTLLHQSLKRQIQYFGPPSPPPWSGYNGL